MDEDVAKIHEVLLRYAWAIDFRDWPRLRTCFTDDFVGDYGVAGSWTSGDAITDFMEEGHKPFGQTLHRITNIVAQVDGDRATACSYVDAMLMPLEPGGHIFRAIGFYDDELVKRPDWRISSRRLTLIQLG